MPRLSAVASGKICSIAEACTLVDEVFDIMEVIRADLSRNATLVKLSATLREKHLRKLLGNQRFRAQLDSRGKDALWKEIDRLTSRVFWADMTEKSYVLCEQHKANIFRGPVEVPEQRVSIFGGVGRCSACLLSGTYGGREGVAGTAWLK